jgi:hypothetical protein
VCRIPRALTSSGELSARMQPESARLVAVQTDRSTLTVESTQPNAPESPARARRGRTWVWVIFAGAVAVGVINVVAIALVG